MIIQHIFHPTPAHCPIAKELGKGTQVKCKVHPSCESLIYNLNVIQSLIWKLLPTEGNWIVRHSSPQTFITSDIHHPLPIFRHSSPQTFITSDVHHLRHSSPQTFITSDVHHPLPKIRHSSPQTFITPYLNSDIHHLRRSSPQTFITP